MKKELRFALLILGLLSPLARLQADIAETAPHYSAEQLQADFRFMQDAISKTHPGLEHSTDAEQLSVALKVVESKMQDAMTRDEAWRLLATLNPVFADAHLAITQPNWQEQITAHVKAGGVLFPYEVHIDKKGELFVRAELGGGSTPLAGARIDSINGVSAQTLVDKMLALAHGDTAAFRANVLSRRFAFFYWKLQGEAARYHVVLKTAAGKKTMRVAATNRAPEIVSIQSQFNRQFQLELLPDSTALLTINSFYWPEKKQFFDFAEHAFTQLRDAKTQTLIIDVRENGGGDDDMWKEGILRYIADKPYRAGSSYRKKVIEGRQSETEKVGDVVTGVIENLVTPAIDHPLHFSGKTYVLVGRYTYSSAVLFSNVMQDYGFGTLVGEEGYVRARQSGGVQNFVLPNTGLELGTPRFVLDRPSGVTGPALIKPDILLKDNPFDRHALVSAVQAVATSKSELP